MRGGRSRREAWQRVGFFLAFTAACSAVFWFLIIEAGRISAGHGLYITGLQWCPGIAALVARYRYEKTVRGLGWQWPPVRSQVLSYVIPIAYITPVYVITWMTGLGSLDESFLSDEKVAFGWSGLPDAIALVFYVLVVGSVGMIQSSATALGEEIGWRGFLVPELAKATGFTNVSLISGVAWATWHYPLFLYADYGAGPSRVVMMACFTITVVGLSFLYAWMRLASGSLWSTTLLHASHNLFVENIFDPLTAGTASTRYITGEFGAGLAAVSLIVALLCWRRRGQLPDRLTTNVGAITPRRT